MSGELCIYYPLFSTASLHQLCEKIYIAGNVRSICRAPSRWPVAHCDALFQNELRQPNSFSICFCKSLASAV